MAAAASLISCCLSYRTSVDDRRYGFSGAKTVSSARFRPKFIVTQRKAVYNYKAAAIRCEQNGVKEGKGLDVWLGRLAMLGFAAAVVLEVRTGKGLLENVGLTAPLPTLALAFTAFAGLLTALVIFQSASEY